jgi:hypothetical protein
VLLFVRSGETNSSTMAVRYVPPPTLSSTVSFGSGSWYTTERILQEHTQDLRCDVEAVVVLLFEVRRNYTTLQPWPFELRCKPPTLSSTASFGSGSWYH